MREGLRQGGDRTTRAIGRRARGGVHVERGKGKRKRGRSRGAEVETGRAADWF